MDGTEKKDVLQWHPAFFAGIQIEFEEEKDNLTFENEHQLSKKPMEIDVLIIKKDKDIPIKKNIGRIFRKYNIIEYKSPDDYLSIDDFYKVLGYAYFYKADTERVDEIKIEDLTVTFICYKYPRKLIRHLEEKHKDKVEEYENGIYAVKGENISIQIVLTSKLSEKRNLWLKCLGNPLRNSKTAEKLTQIYKGKRKNSLYEAVMDMIIQTNKRKFMEETSMCQALEELFDEIMGEKLKEKVEEQVKERVEEQVREKVEAQVKERVEEQVREQVEISKCIVKAETILEFLENYGEIPDELRARVLAERNMGVLKNWSNLAAKTASVKGFQMAM